MPKISNTPPVPAASHASVNTVKKESEVALTQKIKKPLEREQDSPPEEAPPSFDDYA